MEQKPQMPLSRLAIMSLLLFAIIGISQLLPGAVVPVDYSTFISQVNEGQLKEVKAYPNGSYMTLTGLSAQDDKETKTVMLTETYRTLVEGNNELAAKVTLREPM